MCARLRAESAEIQALMEWQYCLRVEQLKVVLMAVMIVCQANFHLQQYPLSKEKQGKKAANKESACSEIAQRRFTATAESSFNSLPV